MSTGKIGRTLNPRSKVTPGYTSNTDDKESKNHELISKLDSVITSIESELKPLVDIISKQNTLVVNLSQKVEILRLKLQNSELENKNIKIQLSEINKRLVSIEEALQKQVKTSEIETKGWFK